MKAWERKTGLPGDKRSRQTKDTVKRNEAETKIVRLLSSYIDETPETLEYLAAKIYADVVAPAVDDERSLWIILQSRRADPSTLS